MLGAAVVGFGDGCGVVGAGIGSALGVGVGPAEGFEVGTLVGDGIGTDVGNGIGTDVGKGVGMYVGVGIGWAVGVGIGMAVGTELGTIVGAGIGTDVGMDVGTGLGNAVGADVGAGVGVVVGVEVGAGVGLKVEMVADSTETELMSRRRELVGFERLWISSASRPDEMASFTTKPTCPMMVIVSSLYAFVSDSGTVTQVMISTCVAPSSVSSGRSMHSLVLKLALAMTAPSALL